MEVYVNLRQKAHVNPLDVINQLIDDEIGYRNWIFEKDDKYFVGFERSAGSHSYEDLREITKDVYIYVKALEHVKFNLMKKDDINK